MTAEPRRSDVPKGHLRFKRDAFKAARGGRSAFLNVFCDECGTFLAIYQKDGPGPLKRMYVDRMAAPAALAKLHGLPAAKLPPLRCPGCKQELGLPIVYAKETRPAYRLFQSAVKLEKNKHIRQRLAKP